MSPFILSRNRRPWRRRPRNRPARPKEFDDFFLAQRLAAPGFHQDRVDLTSRGSAARRASQRRIRHGRLIRDARGPIVGAGKPIAIDAMQERRAQSRIGPALHLPHIRRIDCQSLDKLLARRVRRARQCAQMRPGRFGIDVIGSHRRHATPIVDARVDKRPQRPGAQVRRCLNVHRTARTGAARRRSSKDAPQATAQEPRPCAFRTSAGSSGR